MEKGGGALLLPRLLLRGPGLLTAPRISRWRKPKPWLLEEATALPTGALEEQGATPHKAPGHYSREAPAEPLRPPVPGGALQRPPTPGTRPNGPCRR